MESNDPEAQIGRQIALAGLALSQVAYLMDQIGPIGLSDVRHTLAQRKVLALLSESAHLAFLFEMGGEHAAARRAGARLRVVRHSTVPAQEGADEQVGSDQEPVLERKPIPADVERDELTWECSTLSTPHGLEIAEMSGGSVAIRDADDPDGPVLVVSRWEWETFALSVSAGAFVQPH